ncbi:MAG: hypothetical protein R2939_05960 [Kofleriaceae bacterium]
MPLVAGPRRRRLGLAALATLLVAGCGGAQREPVEAAPTAAAAEPSWPVPEGWNAEVIPFPLGFAPALPHTGVEVLRFPPGFLDPDSGEYWSYTFVWRTNDPAELGAAPLGDELTTYFRGLVAAVDTAEEIAAPAREAIAASAVAAAARFDLVVRTHDASRTKLPVELVGWASRDACADGGALWRIVLAPAATTIRAQLDELAVSATCTSVT